VDLRGLEAVLAVHEHGSFSDAAAALYLSQPALTRRVAQLEQELDTRLFVRAPRRVYLTDTGRALIEPARRALREAESIRGAIDLVRAGERGNLSIVGMSNLNAGLGPLISRFHEAAPEVEIRLVAVESTASASALVEAGVHDLAIVDLPFGSSSLLAHPLPKQDFYAVFAAGATGVDQTSTIPVVNTRMLEGRTMVHLPNAQFPTQRGMQLFDMVGVQPSAHMEVSNCGLLIPIAKSGRTVSVVPHPVAMLARAEGLDLGAPPRPIQRTLAFARHPANASTAVRHFLGVADSMTKAAVPF
jgi:DNA-binding transcriptional LysR family regulator